MKPLPLHAALQDKNFLLISLLQANPGVRSAAREINRYNIPMSKPALVVSDPV